MLDFIRITTFSYDSTILFLRQQKHRDSALTTNPYVVGRVIYSHQNAQKLSNKCETHHMSYRCKLIIEHQNNEVIPLQRCKLAVRLQILARKKTKGREHMIKPILLLPARKPIAQERERHHRKTEDILGIAFPMMAFYGK